jgi:S-disulfanyl-L-cysteine oxidoreductase SoxD
VAAAAAALLAAAVGGNAEETSSSVWDGVYTDAQSTRGRAAYADHCALCHGVTLGGVGGAPPLTGGRFIAEFDGLTLGALFDRIRTSMPLDKPGSLGRPEYADILAFMLQINGFPPGPTELYLRSEYLNAIAFEAQRRAP